MKMFHLNLAVFLIVLLDLGRYISKMTYHVVFCRIQYMGLRVKAHKGEEEVLLLDC